ncbi:MAG: carboxyltransferase domain-containing protein [Rhodobacteraceae bacterium]|nr:carboxyltransferase domain-containing protein [Paracoccaceae bacterium]
MPPRPPSDWPVIRTVGVDGMLVSFGDRLSEGANRAALAFRAALDGAPVPGQEETSTSLASVYVRFDLRGSDHAAVHSALTKLLAQRDWFDAALPHGRKRWRVPAVFGTALAPQLSEAAALAGLSPDEAIRSICATPLRVQTIGFAPGQPYLGELPPHWDIPRQTGLTPRVPEGALVVAIRQMVVFSVSAPTGWRHVGQTALRLFRPDQPDPFLLRPGDEVQFVPVSAETLDTMRRTDPAGGAVAVAIAQGAA